MAEEETHEQEPAAPHCAACGRQLLHPRKVDDGQGGTTVLGRVCARRAA